MALFFNKIFVKRRGKLRVCLENPPVRQLSEVNYLDTEDLVSHFGVSLRQVYNWISSGTLKPNRRVGREYYFRKEDIDAFIKKRSKFKKGGRPPKKNFIIVEPDKLGEISYLVG